MVVPAAHQRHLWEVRLGPQQLNSCCPPAASSPDWLLAGVPMMCHCSVPPLLGACCCVAHRACHFCPPAPSTQPESGAGVPAGQHMPGDMEVTGCDGPGALPHGCCHALLGAA